MYISKYVTTKLKGSTLRGVNCQNCGHQYHYALKRVGRGRSEAPLLGSSEPARLVSQDIAESDLARRLTMDFDSVPCPKCGWLQLHMVERDRIRKLRWIIILSATLPVLAALVVYWPNRSRVRGMPWIWDPDYVLSGIAILLLALLLPILRLFFVRRFNPNEGIGIRYRPKTVSKASSLSRKKAPVQTHFSVRKSRIFGNSAVVTGEKNYEWACQFCDGTYSYTIVGLGFDISLKGPEFAQQSCIRSVENNIMRQSLPIGCPHCGRLQREMYAAVRPMARINATAFTVLGGIAVICSVAIAASVPWRVSATDFCVYLGVFGIAFLGIAACLFWMDKRREPNPPESIDRWLSEPVQTCFISERLSRSAGEEMESEAFQHD